MKLKLLHYPRLDTVLMVEKTIRKYDGEYTITQLWRKLPKKVMFQTYRIIIDYLLYSGKISIDSKGKVGWIFYPENVAKRLKHKHLFWKNV
jgi:hypothetical protein